MIIVVKLINIFKQFLEYPVEIQTLIFLNKNHTFRSYIVNCESFVKFFGKSWRIKIKIQMSNFWDLMTYVLMVIVRNNDFA